MADKVRYVVMVFVAIVTLLALALYFNKREIRQKQAACLGNLGAIRAAKSMYESEHNKTNGWRWESDELAFLELVPEYLKGFPVCPCSGFGMCSQNVMAVRGQLSNEERAQLARRSASDYDVNPIGVQPTCTRCPETHIIP